MTIIMQMKQKGEGGEEEKEVLYRICFSLFFSSYSSTELATFMWFFFFALCDRFVGLKKKKIQP